MKKCILIGFFGWLAGNMTICAVLMVASQIVYQRTGKILYVGFIESAWTQIENVITPVTPPKRK